jgi:hypothetical protein
MIELWHISQGVYRMDPNVFSVYRQNLERLSLDILEQKLSREKAEHMKTYTNPQQDTSLKSRS